MTMFTEIYFPQLVDTLFSTPMSPMSGENERKIKAVMSKLTWGAKRIELTKSYRVLKTMRLKRKFDPSKCREG